jgi:hypothetical protein
MRLLKAIVYFLYILFGSILGTELGLRLTGYGPLDITVASEEQKTRFIPPFTRDPLSGWTLLPGTFELLLAKRDRRSLITINQDSSRITSNHSVTERATSSGIVFIGDSYTFGEGLDNNETMAWQVQQQLPEINVYNFGVPGYGTCQSWLRVRKLLSNGIRANVLVYGFSDFHEERNILAPQMDWVTAIRNSTGSSEYPRCYIAGSSIVVEAPRDWSLLISLARRSALAKSLVGIWLSLLEDSANSRRLTEALLLELNALSKKHGSTFLVFLQDLSIESHRHYVKFFTDNRIPYSDGSTELANGQHRLPDGHPGPETNRAWAEKIVADVQRLGTL